MNLTFPTLTSMLTWACPAARCGQRVTSVPRALRNTATTLLGARSCLRKNMSGVTISGLTGFMIPLVITIIRFSKRLGSSTMSGVGQALVMSREMARWNWNLKTMLHT